ncbi:hypothetical protein ABZ714_25040 [Streptomyces sp. NPDC006798]|uniref:hypothetical protein n=1 Tax=Streptomyces sp. NPDC006798 TaxID=3155462 RepID=UPI0033C107B7
MKNDRPRHDLTRSRRAPLAGAATAAAVLLAAATGCAGPAAAESGPGGERTASERPAADRAGTKAEAAARDSEPRMVVRSAADSGVALYARLQGTLVVTPERCLAVATGAAGTAPTPIAWADGWSVRTENGKAVVHDAEGAVFAREGDRVGLGGGGSGRFADHPCVGDSVWEANAAQAGSA